VKARAIEGLDPGGPLVPDVARIVSVRLEELRDRADAALSADASEAQHDLRIAAKRLRYVLETTQDLFGPYAATAVRRTKELQELLGDMHDCDEMLPRVRRIIAAEQAAEVEAVRSRASGEARDLDPALARDAPRADAWRGLHAFAAWVEARRALLHDAFLRHWTELGRAGFRARLEYALAERAPEPEPEPAPQPEPELPDPDPEPALAARTEP